MKTALDAVKMLLVIICCCVIAAALNFLFLSFFYRIEISYVNVIVGLVSGFVFLLAFAKWTGADRRIFVRWLQQVTMYFCALVFASVLRFAFYRKQFSINGVDIGLMSVSVIMFFLIRSRCTLVRKT